jgi:hypothetical protein
MVHVMEFSRAGRIHVNCAMIVLEEEVAGKSNQLQYFGGISLWVTWYDFGKSNAKSPVVVL